MASYYFLYPSLILGGAELLFARIATELSKIGHAVTILDINDGQVSKNVAKNDNVKIILVNAFSPIKLDDGTLIVPASFIMELNKWIDHNSQCKLLFWCIHPYNTLFVPPLVQSALYSRPQLLKFINTLLFKDEVKCSHRAVKFLIELNGLVFMDDENLKVTSSIHKLDIKTPIFVPIPLPDAVSSVPSKNISELTTLQIYWVGRLADFKVHILEYIILELAKEKHFNSFCFNIVGDGPEKNRIIQQVTKSGIHYVMHGELSPNELRMQLIKDCDLLFAMGTSALEGASLGIPTVLVDATYNPIKQYLFSWLYQSSGYSLGKLISGQKSNRSGMTMPQIIRNIYKSWKLHGELTQQYFIKHHSMSYVLDKFLQATYKSEVNAKTYFDTAKIKTGYKKKIWQVIKKRKCLVRRICG